MADMERLEQALDGIACDHVSSIVMSCDNVSMYVRVTADPASGGSGVKGSPAGGGSSSGERQARGEV